MGSNLQLFNPADISMLCRHVRTCTVLRQLLPFATSMVLTSTACRSWLCGLVQENPHLEAPDTNAFERLQPKMTEPQSLHQSLSSGCLMLDVSQKSMQNAIRAVLKTISCLYAEGTTLIAPGHGRFLSFWKHLHFSSKGVCCWSIISLIISMLLQPTLRAVRRIKVCWWQVSMLRLQLRELWTWIPRQSFWFKQASISRQSHEAGGLL